MINDDLIDEVLNQFQDDKISMAKPMFQEPLPTGRYYYPRPQLLHLYYLKKIL